MRPFEPLNQETLKVAALAGLVVFAEMLRRSVSIERLSGADALHRFDAVRAEFGSAPPLVRRGDDGRLVRAEASGRRGDRPSHLHVLVYRASADWVARSDIPLWFLKIKGPAAADLENAGAGLVLDELREGGDRLLVWTQ